MGDHDHSGLRQYDHGRWLRAHNLDLTGYQQATQQAFQATAFPQPSKTGEQETLERLERLLEAILKGNVDVFGRITATADRVERLEQRLEVMADTLKALLQERTPPAREATERPRFPSNALNHGRGW